MSQSDRYSPVSGNGRNMALAGAVVVAHAAAVIALQHGLGKVSAPEVVVPATVIAEFVTAPAPEPSPDALAANIDLMSSGDSCSALLSLVSFTVSLPPDCICIPHPPGA